MRCPLGCFGPAEGTPLNSLEPHFTPNLHVATPQVRLNVSAPNPGDVLPLWNPEIPGEEIQAGRLGIRIRPGSPAAEKVHALEAFGGAERLREMLEELKQIDG